MSRFQVSGVTFQVSGFRFLMAAFLAAGALLTGCATMTDIGASIGEASGAIKHEEAESIRKTGQAFGKAMEQITPEQEYYVGRAVGATIAGRYKILDDPAATRYVNLLGQTLAQHSAKPETFGGYHFLILDADEINAFAAPGGLIFVSKGLMRLCASEDELASVLAHEVGHVQLGHAVSAISNSRWTQAWTVLGTEAARTQEGLTQLTTAFEGSIGDITHTLCTSGYARGQEKNADEAAVKILRAVGYDPRALVRVLEQMKQRLKPGGTDFAATHPPPDVRIADLNRLVGAAGAPGAEPPSRAQRFRQSMAKVGR
jgi:beta-barrel assembly-enhancing protease